MRRQHPKDANDKQNEKKSEPDRKKQSFVDRHVASCAGRHH